MADEFDKNNIVYITDGLEKYKEVIKSETKDFDFFQVTLHDIQSIVKKIKSNKTREKILLIINKDIFDDKTKEKIKITFSKSFKISNPHYLFISTKKFIGIEEQRNLFEEQNFFYQISEAEDKKKKFGINHFFIKLVFQRMKDLSRLNDYIVNSFQTIVDSNVITQQKEKIEKLYQELESLSKIDVLTSVLNRRALFEALETEKSRTLRDLWRLNSLKESENIDTTDKEPVNSENIIDKEPKGSFLDHYGRFACLMIDLDDFKQVNDTYGHLAGDYVLRELGDILRSNKIFRENDIIGRYGGEEFVIILPETNREYAKIPANRLRDFIKNHDFTYEKQKLKITVSIGISEFKSNDKNSDELIDRADKALYYAKNHGKDSTIVFEEKYNK